MLVVFIGTFYAAGELFADWWLLQVFVDGYKKTMNADPTSHRGGRQIGSSNYCQFHTSSNHAIGIYFCNGLRTIW